MVEVPWLMETRAYALAPVSADAVTTPPREAPKAAHASPVCTPIGSPVSATQDHVASGRRIGAAHFRRADRDPPSEHSGQRERTVPAGRRIRAAPNRPYAGCQISKNRDVTLCRCVELRYFAIFNPRGHATLCPPYVS